MTFNLSQWFQFNTGSTQNQNVQSIPMDSLNLPSAGLEQKLRALVPGQTIQGEIVGMKGSEIQILLGEQMLVNAKLDHAIQMSIGQMMSFQIRSNSQSLLSLTPLSVNLTTDGSVIKALNEAGLPVTDSSVEMVNALMKEGMPIDKETLLNVNKELMTNPGTSVETIVQMYRLEIPITPENIMQFEAYKNGQYQIGQSAEEIAGGIPPLLAAMVSEGDGAQALELLTRLLQVFDGSSETGKQVIIQTQEGAVLNTEQGGGQAPSAGESVPGVIADNGQYAGESASVLTEKEYLNLLESLKGAGADPELIRNALDGSLDGKQLSDLLQLLHSTSEAPKVMNKLFHSLEFSKLIKNEILKQWTVLPEQVDKEHMERLYTKLSEQTKSAAQLLESYGKADTALAKSVTNLNSNIDFMNQMNHMFAYVQIPVKLAKDTAHGDLYVYTNKKNLSREDGTVSALLHLDMPHLGMIDIYVAMREKNVSTKFYLQDEGMISFMEKHLHILNDHLSRRGYTAEARTELRRGREEANSVMEEILARDRNVAGASLISMQSFDVRA